jgi:hypothetical protein
MCTKSTNTTGRTDPTDRLSNDNLGLRTGRSDSGYTLLLERMTIEEWEALRAGDIDAEKLQAQILGTDERQADLTEWVE